jgi:hypothetical protein
LLAAHEEGPFDYNRIVQVSEGESRRAQVASQGGALWEGNEEGARPCMMDVPVEQPVPLNWMYVLHKGVSQLVSIKRTGIIKRRANKKEER